MRRRLAAVDVGSNTVHLLVAEPDGPRLREVHHEVLMPRIGKAVQATGRVGEAKLAEVVDGVSHLRTVAEELGAERLLLGATEAIRRAADRDAVLAAVGAAGGATCRLISGDAEARLSFRGVSAAHPGPGQHLVADIGGGSTECVLGEDGRIAALASVRVGSGSATETWLGSDPPTEAQLAACRAGVSSALASAPPGAPARGSVTGGTATTLPILLDRPEGGGELDGDDLERCRRSLAAEPSTRVSERHRIPLARARVLAGGVEIVAAVMEHYGLAGLAVSHQGLRDGMILAYMERGDDWVRG